MRYVRKNQKMKNINLDDLIVYMEQNIGTFHKSRLDSLRKLKLENILKRKNPYLYKAKNILIASELVKTILDALDLHEGEVVIEIGPGHGVLTLPLAERCAEKKCHVVAVEKDVALGSRVKGLG